MGTRRKAGSQRGCLSSQDTSEPGRATLLTADHTQDTDQAARGRRRPGTGSGLTPAGGGGSRRPSTPARRREGSTGSADASPLASAPARNAAGPSLGRRRRRARARRPCVPPPRSPITWPRPRPRPSPDTHAQPARSRGPAPPSPARGRGSRSPPEWPLARKRARGTAPSLPAAPPHPPSDVRAPAERCGRSFPIARSPVRNLL